jgi:hypothetical protein
MTDNLAAKATPAIEQAAEAFMQWTILNADGATVEVKRGERYLLKNSTNRHFLYNKEQTFGINLGFSDDAEPPTARKVVHWEFLNRERTPVKYGEPVALGCKWRVVVLRTTGIRHQPAVVQGPELQLAAVRWTVRPAGEDAQLALRLEHARRHGRAPHLLRAGDRREHRLAQQQDLGTAGSRLGQGDGPEGGRRILQEPSWQHVTRPWRLSPSFRSGPPRPRRAGPDGGVRKFERSRREEQWSRLRRWTACLGWS